MPHDFPIDSARDVLGILRGMYRAEREPTRRAAIAGAGRTMRQAIAAAEGEDVETAHELANQAIETAFAALHWNAALAPVLGSAAAPIRRR